MIHTSARHTDNQVSIDAYGGVTHAKLISKSSSSLSFTMTRAIQSRPKEGKDTAGESGGTSNLFVLACYYPEMEPHTLTRLTLTMHAQHACV